ncbi:hypothetical protein F5Y05DRAFT_405387 [Hypoxylon sp. FL0543]|nr:hypothetical protein F5Y05DRAFT_405387 [Hypoxylon sp. FL0543]
MFRRLWAGLQGPATSRVGVILRPGPRHQTYQSFFTRRAARSELGLRTPQSQHRILEAGVYGLIFMSVAMLVTDTSMSYRERRDLALKTIFDIVREEDEPTKVRRYCETGLQLLGRYSGAEIQHHGPLRPDPEAGWRDDELVTWLMSTPDPDYPGWTFVLCQALLLDPYPEEVYITQHGNRCADASQALMPAFDDFARDYGGPVRGVLLMMQQNGDGQSLYFDGKRWINIAYIELQAAD